jgi:hypothetical protein
VALLPPYIAGFPFFKLRLFFFLKEKESKRTFAAKLRFAFGRAWAGPVPCRLLPVYQSL